MQGEEPDRTNHNDDDDDEHHEALLLDEDSLYGSDYSKQYGPRWF